MGPLLACFLAATLQLQNRAPRPEEIGYRPPDGAVVSLTPPSLTWLHEPAARTYAVQWATREDWGDAVTVDGIPWNVYTHSEPLAPGAYRWRYRFTDRAGRVSDWSVVRRFTVPAGAVPFPMPTRAERRERVLRGRPRLFVRPEDLPRLREAARTERFAAIRAEADRLVESNPPREPEVRARAHDPATPHLWWPNRVRSLRAGEEACTVAFVYLYDRRSQVRGGGAEKDPGTGLLGPRRAHELDRQLRGGQADPLPAGARLRLGVRGARSRRPRARSPHPLPPRDRRVEERRGRRRNRPPQQTVFQPRQPHLAQAGRMRHRHARGDSRSGNVA